MTTILYGHSYPIASLADVIEAEARQGRKVTTIIQHAGGWAVTGGALPDVATDELMEFLQEHHPRHRGGEGNKKLCRYCEAELPSEKVRLHLRICDACLPEALARFRKLLSAEPLEQNDEDGLDDEWGGRPSWAWALALDKSYKIMYNECVGVAPDPGAAKAM